MTDSEHEIGATLHAIQSAVSHLIELRDRHPELIARDADDVASERDRLASLVESIK
jgi:hypothetical protein